MTALYTGCPQNRDKMRWRSSACCVGCWHLYNGAQPLSGQRSALHSDSCWCCCSSVTNTTGGFYFIAFSSHCAAQSVSHVHWQLGPVDRAAACVRWINAFIAHTCRPNPAGPLTVYYIGILYMYMYDVHITILRHSCIWMQERLPLFNDGAMENFFFGWGLVEGLVHYLSVCLSVYLSVYM